ncbi:hypothetical protein N7490_011668 [Penicillium lividum]|nr:hypothetical protein N7490_011668 [Penicillium lividum]
MRLGQPKDAWVASSTYSHLVEEIYRFEISLPQIHRFKNLGLSSRLPGDIAQYREYWASWLLLQITFHTTHALLNHPVFHVLGHERSGNKRSNFRPPSFVQNTIDQAILHAGWTSQLIGIANDLNIEMNDPVIGHQVIVCATVHWIFSFASNATVAERAISDLGKCQQFIVEIASRWPQFGGKANVFHQLQNSLRQSDSPLGDRGLPGFTASLLWDLIDPFSMRSEMTAFPTSATVGKRVPTDHLAQLYEPPISGSDEYQDNRFGTEQDPYCAPFIQFPGICMDEEFLSSELISESLDLRYMSGRGPFGDL